MANTTFTGAVRSENGFSDITKSATTGAVTTNSTYGTNASIGGTLGVTGVTTLTGNAGPEAGTGITTGTGTIYASTVTQAGGMWHTSILMDLTGLASSGSGDIIGKAGTASSNIGTTTVALNGTILGGSLHA